MKNIVLLSCSMFFLSICYCNSQVPLKSIKNNEKTQEVKKASIYDYTVMDIEGKEFSFKSLKGKKILIVNTASKCGYTPQYQQLEELYQKYKEQNLVIIGFPANNFGEQEPGTNKEIAIFCTKNYGVTFPMMAKVSVEGKGMSAVYEFLTKKSKNGVMDSTVEWNFQKYLINEKGELVNMFPSKVQPLSDEITNAIMK